MRTTAALALLFCTACMRTPLTDKQAYLVASGELETGNRPVIRTPAESAGVEPDARMDEIAEALFSGAGITPTHCWATHQAPTHCGVFQKHRPRDVWWYLTKPAKDISAVFLGGLVPISEWLNRKNVSWRVYMLDGSLVCRIYLWNYIGKGQREVRVAMVFG